MGNASARGTYEERKAAAMARGRKPNGGASLASAVRSILGANWIVPAKHTLPNGDVVPVRKRERQRAGFQKSADGRIYHFDGQQIRRATPDEIAALEGKS